MILSTPDETPTHRLGTYYLETGYGIRPSKVTYDRKHSAFTEYDLSKWIWTPCWTALTGCIFPALPRL